MSSVTAPFVNAGLLTDAANAGLPVVLTIYTNTYIQCFQEDRANLTNVHYNKFFEKRRIEELKKLWDH